MKIKAVIYRLGQFVRKKHGLLLFLRKLDISIAETLSLQKVAACALHASRIEKIDVRINGGYKKKER